MVIWAGSDKKTRLAAGSGLTGGSLPRFSSELEGVFEWVSPAFQICPEAANVLQKTPSNPIIDPFGPQEAEGDVCTRESSDSVNGYLVPSS